VHKKRVVIMVMPTWKPNLEEVEKICRLNPTDVEIAAYFGVSQKTIQRNKKNKKFADAMERGFAHMRMSLKRKQLELALSGNTTMCIWLGKQYLGQTDKVEQQVDHITPPRFHVTFDDE
jgi:hypothetical protein